MKGLRCLLLAVSVVSLSSLSVFAVGGDDDKKGSKGSEQDKAIKSDTLLNAEVGDVAVDDTLVFEDWEKPKGNSNGSLDNSSDICFAIDLFRPILENENEEEQDAILTPVNTSFEIFIYPNPTASMLYFTTSEEPVSAQIVSLSGQVQNVKILTQSVNVSHLPQGTYFIQLIFTNRIESKKFIRS